MFALFSIVSLLFPLVIFPLAGFSDTRPLDLYFCYSTEQAYQILSEMPTDIRHAYARIESSSDLLFPVAYSLTLSIAFIMLLRRCTKDRRWQRLAVLPLFIIPVDWLENHSITSLLAAYPEQLATVVETASLYTSIKWVLIGANAGCLIGVLTLAVSKSARGHRPHL